MQARKPKLGLAWRFAGPLVGWFLDCKRPKIPEEGREKREVANDDGKGFVGRTAWEEQSPGAGGIA